MFHRDRYEYVAHRLLGFGLNAQRQLNVRASAPAVATPGSLQMYRRSYAIRSHLCSSPPITVAGAPAPVLSRRCPPVCRVSLRLSEALDDGLICRTPLESARIVAGPCALNRAPKGSCAGGMEVIVVDNGSNDRSAEVAESLGARVIRLDRNEGFGRAVNRGIEAATGDWIALVNNDVELAGGWLREMLHGAEAANAWFAAGKVLDAADHSQVDGAGDAVCRGGTAWRLGHGRPDSAVFGQVRQIYFPSATATLFRREFFERAGDSMNRSSPISKTWISGCGRPSPTCLASMCLTRARSTKGVAQAAPGAARS